MALSKITNSGIGAIDTLAVDTDTLYVDSTNNRVGIGTSSPSQEMHLYAASGATDFLIEQGSTGNAYLHTKNSNREYLIGTGGDVLKFYDLTADAERMRIDSSGDLLIGATSTSNLGGVNPKLIVQNSSDGIAVQEIGNGYIGFVTKPSGSHNYYAAYFENSTPAKIGGIYCSTTSTSFQTSSDYRLKENVTADWDATTRLKQLNPVRFNFIADADTTVDGFIAHEVQDIVPEAISGTKDAMRDEEYEVTPAVLDDDGNEVTPAVMGTRSVPDYQGIDQSKLVPLLVKTIQELEARIVALETA